MTKIRCQAAFILCALCFTALHASAQVVEVVGSRALGMGGAFVAVANDGTATWWNPAGLAAGPFADLALGRASTDIDEGLPARREPGWWFAVGTPPFGFSYYRVKATNIGPFRTIAPDAGGREDRRAAVPVWSLSATQFGATFVQTLISGVHAGTTLKYVRASGSSGDLFEPVSPGVSDLLDQAEAIDRGDAIGAFDLDVGLIAVRGPVRVGGVMRNVRESEIGALRLPRQLRVGVAFDVSETAAGMPLTFALDADAGAYETPYGDRRVVALGGEGWVAARRLGFRGGARFNTVGARERTFTAGASVGVRSGLYLDGHVAHGGSNEEAGWSVGARATF